MKAEGPIPAALYLGGVVSRVTAKAVGADEASTLRLRPDGHPDCGGQPGPCGYRPPLGGAGLKAGPLMGLWSTGPYLHNGSVRTVYQVISPPEERESVFFIGEPVLDAERIGFVSDDSDGAFRFDTSVPGNGNGGHVFWKEPFTHDERMAIIEYLKNPARFPVPR